MRRHKRKYIRLQVNRSNRFSVVHLLMAGLSGVVVLGMLPLVADNYGPEASRGPIQETHARLIGARATDVYTRGTAGRR